jgi:predicted protein tyrosine phosphatase
MLTVTDMYDAPKHFDEFDLFISILDPSNKTFKLKGPREKHFISRFDDTEHPKDNEWMQMNREVKAILGWVKLKATPESKILVHCHAGVSRSSAVGWLILVMQGMDPLVAFQTIFKARPQIWPNKIVMAIGAKFLDLDPSFMRLVSKVDSEIASSKKEYLGYGG